MNHPAKGKTGQGWAESLAKWYAWSSAGIFALMGLLMLDAASGDKRRMRLLLSPDALFGISNEALLIIAGIIHLALCGGVLLARDPVTRGGLTGWAGLNYLVYRVGMAWVGVAAPFPCVQLISQKFLRATPETLDRAWGLSTAYFLAGAATLLAVQFRHWRRRRKEAFIEHWREVREAPNAPAASGGRASARAQTSPEPSGNQGSRVEPLQPLSRPEGTLSPFEGGRGPSIQPRFMERAPRHFGALCAPEPPPLPPSAPSPPLGGEGKGEGAVHSAPGFMERVPAGSLKELAPGDFKFSCPGCGQHIRCDAEYAGRQITCPACRKEIMVPRKS